MAVKPHNNIQYFKTNVLFLNCESKGYMTIIILENDIKQLNNEERILKFK